MRGSLEEPMNFDNIDQLEEYLKEVADEAFNLVEA